MDSPRAPLQDGALFAPIARQKSAACSRPCRLDSGVNMHCIDMRVVALRARWREHQLDA
jgi:hypothetical protein